MIVGSFLGLAFDVPLQLPVWRWVESGIDIHSLCLSRVGMVSEFDCMASRYLGPKLQLCLMLVSRARFLIEGRRPAPTIVKVFCLQIYVMRPRSLEPSSCRDSGIPSQPRFTVKSRYPRSFFPCCAVPYVHSDVRL